MLIVLSYEEAYFFRQLWRIGIISKRRTHNSFVLGWNPEELTIHLSSFIRDARLLSDRDAPHVVP
jgi:hypothetical protein